MNSYIKIYHGSYRKIEYPKISKNRFTKDFSWGFYCTEIQEQAEKLASKFITPIVNIYELKNFEHLNIKEFKEYTDEWLDFVIKCRNGNSHDYDIVIGPMADDTIYDYIEAYNVGEMNNQYFFDLMKSKYPTHQISLNSSRALNKLNFIENYEINKKNY